MPLVAAGDAGTISHCMHCKMDACFPVRECDKVGNAGTGSALFCWAMGSLTVVWAENVKAECSYMNNNFCINRGWKDSMALN